MHVRLPMFVGVVFGVSACADGERLFDTETHTSFSTDSALESFTERFDFMDGLQDWLPLVAEVRGDELQEQGISFGRATLPPPLDPEDGTIRLAGFPTDDGLFLGMERRIDGLEPGMLYEVALRVELASNLGPTMDTAQVGGGPWLKVGALPEAPLMPTDGGMVSTSFDRGAGAAGSDVMVTVGDLRTGAAPGEFRLLTRMGVVEVQADGAGSVWLVVGTEGAPGAGLEVHYAFVEATFVELP